MLHQSVRVAVTLGLVVAASTARAGTVSADAIAAVRPVTAAVSHAAQAAARSYWTVARMAAASAGPADAAIPSPVRFNGVPTVGALFYTTGGKSHFCTASVTDSTRGDVIATAAHCVYGSSYATHIAYVPEWHKGISPYGEWPVTSITVASSWISRHDQNMDIAFLTVAPPSGQHRPVQAVTGGLRLAVNAGYSHSISVIGYNDTDSQPLLCHTASTEFKAGQMQFSCNDYWDGTSGGPWIIGLNSRTGTGTVFGDIGGYEQGGDYPYRSYSPYYTPATLALYRQASTR